MPGDHRPRMMTSITSCAPSSEGLEPALKWIQKDMIVLVGVPVEDLLIHWSRIRTKDASRVAAAGSVLESLYLQERHQIWVLEAVPQVTTAMTCYRLADCLLGCGPSDEHCGPQSKRQGRACLPSISAAAESQSPRGDPGRHIIELTCTKHRSVASTSVGVGGGEVRLPLRLPWLAEMRRLIWRTEGPTGVGKGGLDIACWMEQTLEQGLRCQDRRRTVHQTTTDLV